MKNCVIIPAYNNERTIYSLVLKIKAIIANVIVIDDGSTDNTTTEALNAGAQIIIHKKNKGKGAALRSGINYANNHCFDNIILLDADGQHDPTEINTLVNALKQADIVIGKRTINRKAEMPFIQNLFNTLISFIISIIIKKRLYDTQSGFRAIKLSALKKLSLKTNRYEIETEMTIKAAFKKLEIVEVPIKTIYHKRLLRTSCFNDFFSMLLLLISPKSYRINSKS